MGAIRTRASSPLEEIGGGDRAEFPAGNVQSKDDVEALIDGAVARFGGLHILVNNARRLERVQPRCRPERRSVGGGAQLEPQLHVVGHPPRPQVHGAAEGGRIINISPVEGKQGNKASVSHYITTKHAINGFTKAVAFEYGGPGSNRRKNNGFGDAVGGGGGSVW